MTSFSTKNLKCSVKGLARAATILGAAVCVSPAVAQLPTLGSETLLHSATASNEHEASISMDAVGNYVVAHTHLDASSNHGIAVRRFDRKGQMLSTVIIPHTETAAVQQQPAVSMANDGRFVVVWEDNQLRSGNNYDIYFALYDAAGALVAGPSRVNSNVTGVRENGRVAMNRSTGEFVVVFAGGPTQNLVDVYYRRFSAAGVALDASDQKVNVSTNQQSFAPSVAMSADGKFIVGWEGDPNGDFNFEAYFQRYTFGTSSATAVGGNIPASETGHDTTEVEVACDESGNFVLAWVDGLPNNSTDPKNLLFRRYNLSGSAVSGVTIFKTGAFSGNGDSLVPRIRVGMEDDEDFVLTYLHNDEIYARFYSGAGTAKGAEIHVNTTTSAVAGEFQSKPWVAINPNGNRAAVVWNGTGASDNNGVHIQRLAEPNQAPVLAAIGNKSGAELQALTFTASATEAAVNLGDTVTFSLDTGAPAGASINAQTGAFTWTPTETQGPGSFPVTVRATDDGEPSPLSDTETITLEVTETNGAPTDLTLSSNIIAENVAAGTTVGTLSTTDSDLPAQTFTYSLAAGAGDDDNASFSIAGNALQIADSPDFETKSSYSVRVMTEDSFGGTYAETYVISVEDVDEVAPTSLATISDPTIAGTNQVVVDYTATDDGGSGIAETALYVRGPGAATFTESGLTPQAGESGTFNYTVPADGIYAFYTKSTDSVNNVEPDPAAAHTSATVNIEENSDLVLTVTTADQVLVFPMTSALDTTITLKGATVNADVTVSRTATLTSPPPYFQQPQYLLKESLGIDYSGASGFSARLEWAFDAANLVAPAAVTKVYQFDGGTEPAATYEAVAVDNVISVDGIMSFSEWYAGTNPASAYNWQLY